MIARAAMLAAGLLVPAGAAAAETVTEPDVRPTLPWLATQLLPSPQWIFGDRGTHFGLRWQVTPLLYSFGMNRRLDPWRLFVAEPFARHAGSVEVFFSPEYVSLGERFVDRLLFRTGVRSYLPLVERGEYLSMSLGASHYTFQGRSGAAIEGGAYVLFGILGAQVTYSPSHLATEWMATLRVRYF